MPIFNRIVNTFAHKSGNNQIFKFLAHGFSGFESVQIFASFVPENNFMKTVVALHGDVGRTFKYFAESLFVGEIIFVIEDALGNIARETNKAVVIAIFAKPFTNRKFKP